MTNTLQVFTNDTFDSTQHFTTKQISDILGQDKSEIEQTLKAHNINPIGLYKTGKKGRPSKIYAFSDLVRTFESFETQVNSSTTEHSTSV